MGEEAVELGQHLRPDVFIMDITMPKVHGIEATRRIKQQQPTAVVIGLSVHDLSQVETAMKNAGAAALLNKETAVETLYSTIHASIALKPRVTMTAHCSTLLPRGDRWQRLVLSSR